MNLNETIAALRELGVADSAIRATLKKKADFEMDDILIALPIIKKVGFASGFYKWLSKEIRSKEEVKTYVMDPEHGGKEDDKGLTNIQRHLKHYESIADMARTIHEANESES